MLSSCCAFGCPSSYRKSTGMKFYRFPTDYRLIYGWLALVEKSGYTKASSRLCYLHFLSGKTMQLIEILKSQTSQARLPDSYTIDPDCVLSMFSHVIKPSHKVDKEF